MVAFVVTTGTSIHRLKYWVGFFGPDSVGNQALLFCPVKQVLLKADYSIL